ncbi:MAG: hypothetical protein FWF81_11490 [Defluviitaleaceae bacterium]|nr:hypothetical protein [Defluviitaleaceae bacterium]
MFTDNLKYATGFVKPKTTSILFDKILISDDLLNEDAADFGYSYIPHEVLLETSSIVDFASQDSFSKRSLFCFDEIEMHLHDSIRSSPLMKSLAVGEMGLHMKDLYFANVDSPVGEISSLNVLSHELGHYCLDLPKSNRENYKPSKSHNATTGAPIQYKYSKNRNKGISSIVAKCHTIGFTIVPVYFSPTEFEKQHNRYSNESAKTPAISICINNLPLIIEDKLDWEQVLEIRSDKKSIEKIRRLKNWLNTDILHKSEAELKSLLDKAIDDYSFALKKHGIQTLAGAISTVSTASLTLLNAVSQSGSFDVAGISIASGLSVFAIKSFIDKIEAKRHPVALIYDLMK